MLHYDDIFIYIDEKILGITATKKGAVQKGKIQVTLNLFQDLNQR